MKENPNFLQKFTRQMCHKKYTNSENVSRLENIIYLFIYLLIHINLLLSIYIIPTWWCDNIFYRVTLILYKKIYVEIILYISCGSTVDEWSKCIFRCKRSQIANAVADGMVASSALKLLHPSLSRIIFDIPNI